MTINTGTGTADGRGPVIIRTSDKRRRLAAIIAVGSLGAAGLIGGTMAAFVDHEYAGLNNTTGQGGYAAATWNLQISADGSAWADTTAPDTPGVADNLAADTGVPINLAIDGANNLIPGDTTTDVTTSFKVRNQDTSTQNAQITDFKLMVDATPGTTDGTLRDALRFDVTRDGATTVAEGMTYAQLAAGVTVDQPILAPGDVVTYTVAVDLPDQGSATENAALQGLHAYLVADVDGTSTTTAATAG